MGKRTEKVKPEKIIDTSYKVIEEGHRPRKILTASEVRQRVYGLFEIYGFFMVDERYLYCFISYIDHKGNTEYTVRQFLSTIEFLPFEIREEIYRDMIPYLKDKFVKNPHIMPRDINDINKLMKWRPRKIELL
jgi:hypothetical protein